VSCASSQNMGRGRPSAEHSRKKKRLEAKLSALDDGRFPDGAPPRPLPTVRSGADLAQAVSGNAQYYAPDGFAAGSSAADAAARDGRDHADGRDLAAAGHRGSRGAPGRRSRAFGPA